MFSDKTGGSQSASNSAAARLKDEEYFHQRTRQLYTQTSQHVLRLTRIQQLAQQQAVANMTRALERLVTSTAEMVGFLVGTLTAGGQLAGKNLFANFLDMLGQFAVMMGTVAVAASKVLEALFSGNPIGLFIGGLAMIAVGGVIKAFASQLNSQGGALGSAAGLYGATPLGGGTATGSSSLTPLDGGEQSGADRVVYYYHFQGGVYDERGLARMAAKALNAHSGKSAPLLAPRVVGTM